MNPLLGVAVLMNPLVWAGMMASAVVTTPIAAGVSAMKVLESYNSSYSNPRR